MDIMKKTIAAIVSSLVLLLPLFKNMSIALAIITVLK